MRIKNLALSLVLVLGVISTVEVRASAQENSFAHPENSHEKEQSMSPEKSFFEKNSAKSTSYDASEGKSTKESTNCSSHDPACIPNVQDSLDSFNNNSKKIQIK